jgi:hypothetical protein
MNKIIVVGIILLFIGVGFQPVISIEINNSNEIIENEEECMECNKVDTETLELLNRNLIKAKFYTRLSLSFLKNNPEVNDELYAKLNF